MKLTKDKISHVKKARIGRSVMGRLAGFARYFLALLVIFVSAHSFSAARIRLDGHPASVTSFEKRQPFIPSTTHSLKTSFVSIDEKNDYSWFVSDQLRAAVWLADRMAVGMPLKAFESDDSPGSFLVLPLRI